MLTRERKERCGWLASAGGGEVGENRKRERRTHVAVLARAEVPLGPLDRRKAARQAVDALLERRRLLGEARRLCRRDRSRLRLDHDVKVDELLRQRRHVVAEAEGVLACERERTRVSWFTRRSPAGAARGRATPSTTRTAAHLRNGESQDPICNAERGPGEQDAQVRPTLPPSRRRSSLESDLSFLAAAFSSDPGSPKRNSTHP